MDALPKEIQQHILRYCTTDTIKVLHFNSDMLDISFWISYFRFHDVKITTKRDSVLDWIYEFECNKIIPLIPEFEGGDCRNGISSRVCTRDAIFGLNYCINHYRDYDIPLNSIKITCSSPIERYIDIFSYNSNGFLVEGTYQRSFLLLRSEYECYLLVFNYQNIPNHFRGSRIYQMLFEMMNNNHLIKWEIKK